MIHVSQITMRHGYQIHDRHSSRRSYRHRRHDQTHQLPSPPNLRAASAPQTHHRPYQTVSILQEFYLIVHESQVLYIPRSQCIQPIPPIISVKSTTLRTHDSLSRGIGDLSSPIITKSTVVFRVQLRQIHDLLHAIANYVRRHGTVVENLIAPPPIRVRTPLSLVAAHSLFSAALMVLSC